LLASVASCFSLTFFLVWIFQSSVGWVVLKKCSFIAPSLYYVSIIAAEICDSFAARSQLDMGFFAFRQRTSGAEGDRLKEAANINKSLSTLGYS
jgi:hypothetical protein